MADPAIEDRRRGLLTGERTAPEAEQEGYWFPRHLAAYAWIADRFGPKHRVLDAGSGEGYGTDGLGGIASFACGIDLDGPTCRHAGLTYPGVGFIRANLVSLPLRAQSFDLVASLQVIEHLWDVPAYLAEITRVLAPGGVACISTPNRLVFSPGLGRGERPLNPFHVQEFDAEELSQALGQAGLVDVAVHRLVHGPRIIAWERAHGPLVPALVDSITRGDEPARMRAFVASLTWQDFDILAPGDADPRAMHDLIGIGWAP